MDSSYFCSELSGYHCINAEHCKKEVSFRQLCNMQSMQLESLSIETNCKYQLFNLFTCSVIGISSDPPCKDSNARFTMVPLIALSDRVLILYQILWLWKMIIFNWTFLLQESTNELSELNPEKTIIINFLLEGEIKLNCLFKSGVLTRHSSFGTMEIQCTFNWAHWE